jgi:hypothetical protein
MPAIVQSLLNRQDRIWNYLLGGWQDARWTFAVFISVLVCSTINLFNKSDDSVHIAEMCAALYHFAYLTFFFAQVKVIIRARTAWQYADSHGQKRFTVKNALEALKPLNRSAIYITSLVSFPFMIIFLSQLNLFEDWDSQAKLSYCLGMSVPILFAVVVFSNVGAYLSGSLFSYFLVPRKGSQSPALLVEVTEDRLTARQP